MLDLESFFNYIPPDSGTKKILADIVIFVAELPLGSCLNSSLQAQMKITLLIDRLIWSDFFWIDMLVPKP